MISYYVNRTTGRFWRAEVDDDQTITITVGNVGGEGEVIDTIDDFERGEPNDYLVESLEPEDEGFEPAPPPDIVDVIERNHDVELKGRIRMFYASREFEAHSGRKCKKLGCFVDFAAMPVLGRWAEAYWNRDTNSAVQLIPISSKTNDNGYEDEQQWIGIDPARGDGPIFALYTSGEYEECYPNLAALLADLE